jgi:aspartate aminotransferase
LEDFNLDGKTIMVAPAAGFYSSEGVGLNQVRIAYVLEENLLKEAVEILREALQQYKE